MVFARIKSVVLSLEDRIGPIDSDAIRPEEWIVDLGLDSLTVTEIQTEIEAVFGIMIGFDELDEVTTWLSLTRLVIAKQSAVTVTLR